MKPPWNGRSVNRSLVAASIAVMLSVFPAGASTASVASPAGAQGGYTYLPRAKGPLKVAGSPTSLLANDRGGNGFSGLEVLNGPQGTFQTFSNSDGNLAPESSTRLPGASLLSDSLGTFADPDWPIHAFVQPDQGKITVTRFIESKSSNDIASEFEFGTRPSSATPLSSLFSQIFLPTDLTGLAVTDEVENTFSFVNSRIDQEADTVTSTPVGTQPVAADSFNELIWFVANRGSDDVSVVQLFAGDAYPTPYLQEIQKVPVGQDPVDVVNVDRRGPEQLVAVVNKGSDTVSILGLVDQSGAEMKVEQEIGVGDQPTSVTALRVNDDQRLDLAVTNSGSDSVSILINDGGGHFSYGQRIKVGDRPVDAASLSLNRYFGGDLAVANAGDRNVSLLLKTPAPGECHGRPARSVIGTNADDTLRGSRDPDLTKGFAGNDDIRGSTGYDCLFGGTGGDDIFGGFDNDDILGGDGADELSGFQGNDLIRAGRGDDEVCDYDQRDLNCYGSPFANYRPNLPDVDRVFGGPGDDLLSAGPGRDRISGGTGNDLINSLDVEVDRIDCGPGRDKAYIDNRDKTTNCEKVIKRQSR